MPSPVDRSSGRLAAPQEVEDGVATALDRAVEVRDVVNALAGIRLTQADLARATGASERSVRNWKRTSAIRPEYEERLQDVRDIALILQDSLTPRGVGQWFRARNRMVGGRRPVELIREGELAKVKEAAQAFVDGAYV
jgi:hypothetical protein